MQNDEKYIKESAKEIFHLSAMLLNFCKHNSDTEVLDCLYTGINLLYKKADNLNSKLMDIK